MTMPSNPMNRVLALFKREADRIAAEAANAKLAVEGVEREIAREMEPDAAERGQLKDVEAALAMLKDRIAQREEKVAALTEQRDAAEEKHGDLAAQAEAAAQVIENARTAPQQPPAGNGSPLATHPDGTRGGQAAAR